MDFLVAIRAVFDGRLQDLPYLLQSFVCHRWCNKTAFTIDEESVLFPLMKWSPSLFGQINYWVVAGAGFVSLQMRTIEISWCTCVPNSLHCPCAYFSLGMMALACNLHVDIQWSHLIALGNL